MGKRHLTVKRSKFLPKFYRDPYRRVVFKFRKFDRWEIGEMRFSPDKEKQNFAWLSSCRYYADRAKNQLGPAADNVLRVLQISSKSIHFRRSYSRTREHRQNAPYKMDSIFGWSLASSRTIIILQCSVQYEKICRLYNTESMRLLAYVRLSRLCVWTF